MNIRQDHSTIEEPEEAVVRALQEARQPPEEDHKPKLDISFLALDGAPIEQMSVVIRWAGGELIARTDADGVIPPVQAPPGEPLSVAVQRFDGSYKRIGECRMPSSDGTLTAISPNIVVETITEIHEGKPGQAEASIPKPEDSDLGDVISAAMPAPATEAPPAKPAEALPAADSEPGLPVITAANGTSDPKLAPRSKGTASPDSGKVKQQAKRPPQHISGKAEGPLTLKGGRDANGHPLAVITEKARDWWNSWRMPTFNLWGAPTTGKQGGTSPATPVSVNTDMIKKVEALLEFAQEQTEYRYTEGTAGVLASMGRGTFKHAKGEKDRHTPRGLCYTYVKVALARSKVVNGMLPGVSASGAGPSLIAQGFKDVTSELPDARWAAAGDLIVYAWTDGAWDLRKKKDPKTPNHGHIDVRDYETYISDFVPKLIHPRWVDYMNIRIYRKVFDPIPTQRIRAFLHCIREFECQAEHDDEKRYQILNTPLPSGEKRFSSYKTHPWSGQTVPKNGSTSAGAYQIKLLTWGEIFEKGLIESKGDMFSPLVQDRIAVMKLEDRGVLHMVRAGRIKEALEFRGAKGALALASEWTSLPGGNENAHRLTADKRPMDMAYFEILFEHYLKNEKSKG